MVRPRRVLFYRTLRVYLVDNKAIGNGDYDIRSRQAGLLQPRSRSMQPYRILPDLNAYSL